MNTDGWLMGARASQLNMYVSFNASFVNYLLAVATPKHILWSYQSQTCSINTPRKDTGHAYERELSHQQKGIKAVPGWAATCVRNVDAETLKICVGSWVRAPAGGNFGICQKYRTTPLTQVTAFPSITKMSRLARRNVAKLI